VARGQDLYFSERGVDEATKKIVNRLLNVLAFFEIYASSASEHEGSGLTYDSRSKSVLDRWIVSRLNDAISAVSAGLKAGVLDRASRPFFDLSDDLSTWYIRRSRDRFKSDGEEKIAAHSTTAYVLVELSKLLAPFMPFLAEEIYLRIKVRAPALATKESVHLEAWPERGEVDSVLLGSVELVRKVVKRALEARMSAGIPVRQPLASLTVRNDQLPFEADREALFDLIREEVNVKNIVIAERLERDVELDLALTPELKEEGALRDLLRKIQDLRKEKALSVGVLASLVAPRALEALITKNADLIKKSAGLSAIEFGESLALKP
jgi:isoleucyl-tRNA synthetase